MKEMTPDASSQLGKFLNSRFEEPPATEAVQKLQVYKYLRPELKPGKKRAGVRLVTTDIMVGFIQVFEHGGEPTMHSHAGMDGFWMVLKGRVRFHLEGDETHEAGPLEGFCTPRGLRYWFESVGDEPLEILQVDAIHPGMKNKFSAQQGAQSGVEAETNTLAFYDAREPADSIG